MDTLAATHDVAVQMIDTSVVRVHQHGACIAGNSEQHMGRSRGGLKTKIHAICVHPCAGLKNSTNTHCQRSSRSLAQFGGSKT